MFVSRRCDEDGGWMGAEAGWKKVGGWSLHFCDIIYRMIIDDLTIRIQAGKGGDGIIAFNKNKGSLGPTGGRGGNGGNVLFVGVSDLGALNALRNQKVFKAEDGKNGRHQLNDGTAGEDLFIKVPVGTVIHD